MTITDTSPRSARNGGRSPDNETPALVDQLVLSSAGLATQGVSTALRVVEGAVGAADTLVLGVFDIAEQLATSSLVADLATKGIAVARQSWSATVKTYRQSLAGL